MDVKQLKHVSGSRSSDGWSDGPWKDFTAHGRWNSRMLRAGKAVVRSLKSCRSRLMGRRGSVGKKASLSLFEMIFLGGKDLWLPLQNICLQSILKGISAADFCCDGGCREYQPDSYLWVNEQVERKYIINDNHLDQNIKKPLRAESTIVPCHHFDLNQVLRWDCLQQETKR